MIQIRKSEDRGHANHGWLEARHSFSFADYYDPAHMGYRSLRVINEDRVQPGQGFGTHPHRDMEIVTYILEGALEHKDSMGNGSIIRPGDVQYMSAGSGVLHSEFNPSKTEGVHLLQIWILPNVKGATPRYGQKDFPKAERAGKLRVIVSPDGRDGSIAIRQDALIFASLLNEGTTLTHTLGKDRNGWLQLARGKIRLNGKELNAGDGAAIEGVTLLEFSGVAPESEFLFFDLN